MSLCAFCGLQLSTAVGLCAHHAIAPRDDGWAATNRAICSLVHRGIAPPRLSPEERADDFWAADPHVV